jgi:hypothetical protein
MEAITRSRGPTIARCARNRERDRHNSADYVRDVYGHFDLDDALGEDGPALESDVRTIYSYDSTVFSRVPGVTVREPVAVFR